MTPLILDNCCGCIKLRTGCLIIGYLNLFYSIVIVIATAVCFSSKDFKEEFSKRNADHLTIASVVAIIALVIILLFLIMNIVFVIGVHQNKRGHVKAYLIYNAVFLVLYSLILFGAFAGAITSYGNALTWTNVVQNLLVIVLATYSLMVIRSFYYKMNDSNHQPAVYNKA